MLKKVLKPISNKIGAFTLVLAGIVALLGIGFISGWKAESLAVIHSDETVKLTNDAIAEATLHPRLSFADVIETEIFQFTLIVGVIISLLLCWTLILLVNSYRYKKKAKDNNRVLKQEIEKRQDATNELHVTHQQLSTTSGQLDGFIQGTTDFIAAIDLDYRFISFNTSFKQNIKELFGTDVQNGMTVDQALSIYPEKLETSKGLWTRALKGEGFTATQTFAKNLENPIYYELTYTPIKNSSGDVVGASQICRDVTERKTSVERLKRERDFASAIFDVNSSLIIVVDREGRIIQFNKACEQISKYREEEVKDRIFWNILIPTEEIADVKHAYQVLDPDEISGELVHQWITKDEEVRLISWQLSAIKDENETGAYIVATGIDITEKSEFETAQKRMLEILENSPDFIRISDLQGHVIYLNPAGRKMLGLNGNTDISHLRTHSCHPNWANDLMQTTGYPTAVKAGRWMGETAIKTLDNTEIPTSHLVLAHRDTANSLEYFSTVLRDISSQKSLQDELEKARDIALETTRVKSEFLANMSHEIRTPMNGIIGITELLQGTTLDAVQRDYADTIQQSGDTLLTIINDILDFSKLEAGKLKFEAVDFDLYRTIESTLDLFAKTVSQKNVELCLLIHRDVPSALRGDPGRLRQVLTNLISNAVKFTKNGEIMIRVKTEKEGKRPSLHFSVSDTGIGISDEVLESLFNGFTQADSTITRRFGGTGLGLAISKQLVQMMSGEIGVKSTLNEGSTFWFTASFETQDEHDNRFENSTLKNVRTLIVDDNPTRKSILLYQTKSWGMLTDEVASAEKAIMLMKAAAKNGEPFEIAILSNDLIKTNGIVLAKKIKNEPNLRNTKIVLIRSIDDQKQFKQNEDYKIDFFVTKPVKQTELFKTLLNTVSDNDEIKPACTEFSSENEITKLTNTGASTMTTEIDKNTRILIAEDNLVNQKVILNQVTGLGYEVDLVENGKQVLDALNLKDYSMILMDCQMPVMDGFEATRAIREREGDTSTHIPIVAVTAHAIEGDRERCLSQGMDDYISKPTKQQVLASTISFWLNKSTQAILSKKNTLKVEPKHPIPPKTLSESENIGIRLKELAETCGDEIVLECIDLFISDTTMLISELSNGVVGEDFRKIIVDAHKLKGSASNMGAKRLPAFCQKIMEFAKDEKYASAQIILRQIQDEYDLLKTIYTEKKTSYKTRTQDLQGVG